MKFRIALVAAAIALPLAADDVPFFRSIDANVSLEGEGSLILTEKAEAENDSSATATLKHRYWTDADEKVQVVSISPPAQYKFEPWGELQLSVPPGQTNYVITTRVTGAVTPVWAVPRGVRSMESTPTDPRDRIRDILQRWRDGGARPRSRYLLDYQYFFPEQAHGFSVQPSISFGDEWKPAHAIQAGALGTEVNAPVGYPSSFRIRHLFDYQRPGTPPAINLQTYAIRSGSIVAFPLAAVVIWLVYIAFASKWNDRKFDIDERWLRENIFNQPPEIIGTQWRGFVQTPDIEEFLRRLERAGKVAVEVTVLNEGTDDEDVVVKVRLCADRSRLTEYERTVIDALMPNADEITSKDIEAAHAGTDFDPMDGATAWLERAFPYKKKAARAPVISRLLTLILMAAGLVLLVADVVRTRQEPFPLLATIVLTNFLVVMWPSFSRPKHVLQFAVIPLLLLFGVVIVVHTITLQPAGEYASLGALAFTLGGFHAIVSGAAKRDARPEALVAAHDWFENQLRTEPSRVRDEWLPYLDAFGLKPPKPLPAPEHWGYALCTFAD